MHISPIRLAARTLGLALLAMSAIAAFPAFSGADCLDFQGLQHCPLGEASLTLSEEGLAVDGLGGTGSSGIATFFATTNSWTANYDVKDGDDTDDDDDDDFRYFRLDVISQGVLLGNGTLQDNPDGIILSAGYTTGEKDSTLSALVFDNGVFQGGKEGIGGDTAAISIPGWKIRQLLRQDLLAAFRVAPGGNGELTLMTSTSITVRLPDGSKLTGNEVRFVEELNPEGHSPNRGFDTVAVQSTGGPLLIQGESVGSRL